MRTLKDAELLALWESGHGRHPLDQAVLVLAAGWPEMSWEALAAWPMGRRNQALARLYCRFFGPRFHAWTSCPNCGEKLEFDLDAKWFGGAENAWETQAEEPVTVNGRKFRLPTSRDLARAAGETDVWTGAMRIVESCLVAASPPDRWSEEEVSAIGEQMALADPLAEPQMDLHCPACGNDWLESLDLVSFFWSQLEARMRQTLFTVHTLASAYGWTEEEILSLGAPRRARYLEMARS